MKGKKKKNNTVAITDNTETLAKVFSLSKSCTVEQVLKIVSENEFNEWRKAGLIEIEPQRLKKSEVKNLNKLRAISDDKAQSQLKSKDIPSLSIVSVTTKFGRFAEARFGITDRYTSNTKLHDVVIASRTETLRESGLLDTCKTEKQVKEELKEAMIDWKKNRKEEFQELLAKYEDKCEGFTNKFKYEHPFGSPPDMAHRNADGQMVAFEVYTSNYTAFDRALKEFSAEILGYKFEYEEI